MFHAMRRMSNVTLVGVMNAMRTVVLYTDYYYCYYYHYYY